MRFSIKKGHHQAFPYDWMRWWPFLIRPCRIQRMVKFDRSASYSLGEDQLDENKLFGVSFFIPHKNSARISWRWDDAISAFVLSAYTYIDGKREIKPICQCHANRWYKCSISISKHATWIFSVIDDAGNTTGHYCSGKRTFFALLLGLYFGGNKTAPHDMWISIL